MNAVTISHLTKSFGSIKALDDINLSLRKGEIFGLLGPNGAGKTTLISIICGLLKKDVGKVEILGKDLDTQLHQIQQKINLVLGFTGIGMHLSVKEFLKYFCYLYNLDNVEQRIQRAMDAVSLTDKADALTLSLSSGYKQRVLLAKALLNDPEVILLDEPTVGLDVDIAIKIRALIQELRKKGTTILLTTHNMYEVEELCDRIALISKGQIIATGTVAEIKKMIKLDKIIEVEVENPDKLSKDMKKQKYVSSIQRVGDSLQITVHSYGDVRKVMKYLATSTHQVYLVKLVEPTLEEAFLKLVRGHHA